MKKIVFAFMLITLTVGASIAQNKNKLNDSIMLRNIYTEALEKGEAYNQLRILCKDIGHRLSGSLGADMAVEWGFNALKDYDFDTVYFQDVMVPHWERGTKERAFFKIEDKQTFPANILALGGSVATNGILSGEIIQFKTLEELENADEKLVNGKIVFLAERMPQRNVNTFHSYGECGKIRWSGPVVAGEKGAIGIIIRSLSLSENDFPNTGAMGYKEGVNKIPAAALSTNDASRLEALIDKGEKVSFHFEMDCKTFPDKLSHNVIAEIKGTQNPNNIITVGGHLDSWDVGEGAHDDGAGIVQSMEALRILKTLGYRPKNTLRVVFFINEENGNRGGKRYAKLAKIAGENHIYAIESDAGGFSPHGFTLDGNKEQVKLLQSFAELFKPYLIHKLEAGYGGVDIYPLKNQFENIALIGLAPDSQRYFDIHHNANDVFENVNKRELHLGAAAMASLMYLLDR